MASSHLEEGLGEEGMGTVKEEVSSCERFVDGVRGCEYVCQCVCAYVRVCVCVCVSPVLLNVSLL